MTELMADHLPVLADLLRVLADLLPVLVVPPVEQADHLPVSVWVIRLEVLLCGR
jgi:hypothetical protein